MIEKVRLSHLTASIADFLEQGFGDEPLWVTAQVTDVKRQTSLRRCYLKMIEKQGEEITAEVRANFWTKSYGQIEEFEKKTGQAFKDGIEITALVMVRFHPRFGLSLEVQQLQVAWTLGTLERERQETLNRLLLENPENIRLEDGIYETKNKNLPLPMVIERIALLTAPQSDGRRDFLQELQNNRHGYTFEVTEFLTTIQGDQAHLLILEKLNLIRQYAHLFDVVCVVRGGGSQIDFKPFDTYEVAQSVASFPIPVITGIGHDRNTSITDMMARQEKTPTKVAASMVERNFDFENRVIETFNRVSQVANHRLTRLEDGMQTILRVLNSLDPENILRRGFAMVRSGGKAVMKPGQVVKGDRLETIFSGGMIISTTDSVLPNG